jgi:hypothetical protein
MLPWAIAILVFALLKANSAQQQNDKADASTSEIARPTSAIKLSPFFRRFLVLCSISGPLIGCQPQPPSVHIRPAGPTTVDAGDIVTLIAIVQHDPNDQGVNWTLPNLPMSSVSTNSTQATFTPSVDITGSLTFVVTATSKASPIERDSVTITVNALPTITSSGAIESSTEGTSYQTKLDASGGTGALSWSLASGTLPAGLSLSHDGTISGTPQGPAVIGSPFSARVVDSDTPPHSSPPARLTLNVYNYPLPGFSLSTLPNATVGEDYEQTVTITDGHPPYTIVDAGLPPGLATIVASSAVDITGTPVKTSGITLTGKPNALGNHYPITVVVADSSNPVQQNSITYYVDVLPSGNPGAEIVADVSQAGPVMQKDQLGVNLAFFYLDSFDPVFEPLFASAGIGLLRWPGGSGSDYYHWQNNSVSTCQGFTNANPNFDVFMQTIPAALRADVAITANYGSNQDCTGPADPNEAAGWVNYANNVQHYGIKYWTVGNEEYYPQVALSPGTFYNIDPATYANRVATGFYPLMKAQDPSIMVGVDTAIASVPVHSAASDPWDYVVLAQAKYDFVEMHYYPFSYNVDDDASLLTTWSNQVGANFSWTRAVLSLNGHPNAPIFLGEFDRNGGGPIAVEHESVSVVNGLFTAIVLAEVAKAGIPMASTWVGLDDCYPDTLSPPLTTAYGLQNFGSWGLFAKKYSQCAALGVPVGTAFPKGQAYRMLSQYILPGEHPVAIASTDPSIHAFAATNKDGYALLLISTDSSLTHTLPVTVSNASRTSYNAMTSVYGKQQYEQSQQGVWAGPVNSNLGTMGTTFSIALPAWSITLVQLH